MNKKELAKEFRVALAGGNVTPAWLRKAVKKHGIVIGFDKNHTKLEGDEVVETATIGYWTLGYDLMRKIVKVEEVKEQSNRYYPVFVRTNEDWLRLVSVVQAITIPDPDQPGRIPTEPLITTEAR